MSWLTLVLDSSFAVLLLHTVGPEVYCKVAQLGPVCIAAVCMLALLGSITWRSFPVASL